MRVNSAWLILLGGSLCLAANAESPRPDSGSIERVRQIILNSRTLGAHGMGYGSQSLRTLSQKLTSSDVPTLIDLSSQKDLHVGVQFALASQCEAALIPVREAVIHHEMPFPEGQEVMRLIEDFSGCKPETQQRAAAMCSDLHSLADVEQ